MTAQIINMQYIKKRKMHEVIAKMKKVLPESMITIILDDMVDAMDEYKSQQIKTRVASNDN